MAKFTPKTHFPMARLILLQALRLSDSWKQLSICRPTGRFVSEIFHFTCPVYTYAKHIWHVFIVFLKLTKNMTDMRGFINFRLRGGRGTGQNLTEKGFVNFLVLKLIYSGFNVLNLFTVGSTVSFKENCTFWFQRGSNIFQGGVVVELYCLLFIELVEPLPPPNLLSGSVHDWSLRKWLRFMS